MAVAGTSFDNSPVGDGNTESRLSMQQLLLQPTMQKVMTILLMEIQLQMDGQKETMVKLSILIVNLVASSCKESRNMIYMYL